MATNTKELLQRANIRTMKKDLQRLREADVLRESAKIVKIGTIEEEKKEKKFFDVIQDKKREPLVPKPQFAPIQQETRKSVTEPEKKEKTLREDMLPQNTEKELDTIIQNKEYANEIEKQQMFLLESQRLDLEKQIKIINSEKKPPLLLEKNKILLEQENLQKQLNLLVKQGGGIEERQRWTIEEKLAKLEDGIKSIYEDYKKFDAEEDELKTKVVGINSSLRTIYSNIIKREEERKEELAKEKELTIPKNVEVGFEQKRKMQNQKEVEYSKVKEKGYLKEIPLAIKEKLAQSTKIEEEQRRKFMEDVEKWAASTKDSNEE